MKGKSYSIPYGMIFKKYYCPRCGVILKKEKTHRVVTKDDKDYFEYHPYNIFPRNDHDVYEYRFKCPSCNKRIVFFEQCIFERIQRKYKKKILSSKEIDDNYKEAKDKYFKMILIKNIFIPIIFNIIFFTLFFFLVTRKTYKELIVVIILFLIATLISIIVSVKKYKGNFKLRINQTYSYEKRSQLEILHTYSSNNRELIKKSNKCYCFYCKSAINSEDIHDYIDEGKTALCPHCGIDSVIPDSINETIDESIIDEMNKYWF